MRLLERLSLLALLTRCAGTPTPPPGPGVDGDGNLVEHNASCAVPCGAWPHGGADGWRKSPRFHVADVCHGENDPNGPVYFNGVYHLFWQAHLNCAVVAGHA